MKSFDHGNPGNWNLRGKKTQVAGCGCCELFNPKESEREKEDRKEMRDAESQADGGGVK